MKKKIFLSILVLIMFLTTNSAFSQVIGAGIKVGASIANLKDADYYQTFSSKAGFNGGAFFAYAFNDYVAIQPEVLYTFKGAKFTSLSGSVEGEAVYDYLEFPLLIKGLWPNTSNFKPSIFVGPSLAILTNAKLKITTPSGYAPRSIREETKSTDFGLSFGAGIDLMLTQGKITFDARYNLGLTGTFETPSTYALQGIPIYNGDDKMKNSVISILLGVSFI